MNQFGKAPPRTHFGQRRSALPPGGRRPVNRPDGRPELSEQAQTFLNVEKRGRGEEPGSSALGFLSAASASTASSSSDEKFGEKPVGWIRVISYLVDTLIIGVPYAIIFWPMFTAEMDAPLPSTGGKYAGSVAGTAAGEFVVWKYLIGYSLIRCLYAVLMEASSFQASFGKMMCGLVVTNKEMRKPGLGAVIMRNTLGRFVLNILPFSIGYWLLAFNPQRKGLHDMMAGTLVCKKGLSPAHSYSEVFA